MRMYDSEVIGRYGSARYEALVGRAFAILKEDPRLVGCDKLRMEMARTASRRAIGCERRSFVPSKGVWRGGAIPEFCEELISACALRLNLDGHVAGTRVA